MRFVYDPLLVLLSLIVAIQASYVGLSLALRVPLAFALQRRLLIAGAATSLATGIWGMHFIGMLAAKSPVAIDYAMLPTLISFLVCVLVTGIAVYLASLRALRMLVVAAIVMGLGIAAMHYIGMEAVHAGMQMSHDTAYVIASIVIAIATSALALWLAFAARRRPPMLISAAVLGCAISGMHYTAMAGVTLESMADMAGASAPAISSNMLAVIVSIVAFGVSGVFMLALVPTAANGADNGQWNSTVDPAAARATLINLVQPAAPSGALATQLAVLIQENTPDEDLAPSVQDFLPIEKNGVTRTIDFGAIVSVHANAHYTYLFDGREDLFCPLSISEIVARLPESVFLRVHRSYIVNLGCVAQIRKAGDNGVAELDSTVRRSVPVSRSRVQQLRAELAQRRANAVI
jgi:diguanylate cyclase